MDLDIRYARSGGVAIAYHVVGDSGIDLVFGNLAPVRGGRGCSRRARR